VAKKRLAPIPTRDASILGLLAYAPELGGVRVEHLVMQLQGLSYKIGRLLQFVLVPQSRRRFRDVRFVRVVFPERGEEHIPASLLPAVPAASHILSWRLSRDRAEAASVDLDVWRSGGTIAPFTQAAPRRAGSTIIRG
jgi:hypothetical protein